MTDVEAVLHVQNELGEGPVWNADERALYWVDIEKAQYHRFDPDAGSLETIYVGEKIGVLAFREQGGLVMATERGFATWDPATRTLSRLGDPEADKPQTLFNDGAVDRRGRFWAGTTGDSFNNSLYRLDPDGALHRMDTGFDVCNGIGWSSDNRTMYFTDSTPAIIYAYDFDLETGAITNRRVFVDSSDQPGFPDGLTVDSEGFVWSARWDGARIDRYDPDGRLERSITVPARFPTSLTFGGDDLRTLYVTSALLEIPHERRAQHPVDGDLFRIKLDIGGLPEPKFAG